MSEPGVGVEIKWTANPFRGDVFEEMWLPAAEAALDYGATGWAFYRAKDGLLDFAQWALFPEAIGFDRYWYSEEIAAARAKASGLYQVPLLPKFYLIAGMGSVGSKVSSAPEAPS
jgi:hypothetical protein